MTNYELIKNMSVEEMARFICSIYDDNEAPYTADKNIESYTIPDYDEHAISKWLNEDVKRLEDALMWDLHHENEAFKHLADEYIVLWKECEHQKKEMERLSIELTAMRGAANSYKRWCNEAAYGCTPKKKDEAHMDEEKSS